MRRRRPTLTSREICVETLGSALPNTISRSGGRVVLSINSPAGGETVKYFTLTLAFCEVSYINFLATPSKSKQRAGFIGPHHHVLHAPKTPPRPF